MSNLAIKGHQTRGKEVIEILKMLGGKNVENYDGSNTKSFYFINNTIICSSYGSGKLLDIDCYTLEQFFAKFPYRVGDRVKKANDNDGYCATIISMDWDSDISEVVYTIIFDDHIGSTLECLSVNLQPYKEETIKKEISGAIVDRFICLEGYDFYDDKGNIINTREITMKKKKPKYPKTYKECCEMLGCKADIFFTDFSYNNRDVEISDYEDKIDDLLQNFRKLRYCRDAYWEIAGEEMGLGKPWEPDWNDSSSKYTITVIEDKLVKRFALIHNYILAFPTEEIRDIFFENFKDLIELCKELL